MRTRFKTLGVVTVLAVSSSVTLADGFGGGRAASIGWHVHQPTRFIVSGVLKKSGTTDTIKPIHAVIVADTDAAAVQQFSEAAQHDYPGYSLVATLASPVPATGRCEMSI